jgi:hypothetical protein
MGHYRQNKAESLQDPKMSWTFLDQQKYQHGREIQSFNEVV